MKIFIYFWAPVDRTLKNYFKSTSRYTFSDYIDSKLHLSKLVGFFRILLSQYFE